MGSRLSGVVVTMSQTGRETSAVRVVVRKEREGRGKSVLGFLERSGLEARISDVGEAFWAGHGSESDGDKYSWPEPRLGKRA